MIVAKRGAGCGGRGRAKTSGADADGEVVWSWRLDADVKFLRSKLRKGDGDKKARSPGRSRRKPLKPFACGNAGCFGVLVVTNARVFYTPRAAAGALAPGIPHALCWRGSSTQRPGRLAPRDRGCASETVFGGRDL